jgi:DNA-binding NtrC family response regulator
MTRGAEKFSMLVVDDEEKIRHAMERFFIAKNYDLSFASQGAEALDILKSKQVDLMLLDLKMPEVDGMEVLRQIQPMMNRLKVIILTGHGGVEDAVEAIKLGASDFLEKGGPPEILGSRVANAHALWLAEQENRQLKNAVPGTFSYEGLIGESPPVAKLKEMIVRVGPSEVSVLIQGESGTGKELVARAIHHHSNRCNAPLVAVDCAAISETVLESELFGHTKGAFTGADRAAQGLIRSAHSGTLFLDEIGELSMNVQAKLLRTIQERVVRPVGSTRNHEVDIRIIAATNRNLLEEIPAGRFRQDLYYRLSAVTLTSPPLRERGDDIRELTSHLIFQHSPDGQEVPEISEDAMACLTHYEWPGNIRELENTLQGALVFSQGPQITLADLPEALTGMASGAGESLGRPGSLAFYEFQAIKNALKQADNNRRKAAAILDIAEATLYRKIKQYKL